MINHRVSRDEKAPRLSRCLHSARKIGIENFFARIERVFVATMTDAAIVARSGSVALPELSSPLRDYIDTSHDYEKFR